MNKFDIIEELKKFKEELEKEIEEDSPWMEYDGYMAGMIESSKETVKWIENLINKIQRSVL